MKKEPQLEITYVPVADLVPYAGNSKRLPDGSDGSGVEVMGIKADA